jgi:hypothetical protein
MARSMKFGAPMEVRARAPVPPDPGQRRRVFWALVGAMLLTAAVLGLTPRVGG